MTPVIRDARAEDEGEWRRLWADYLAFYRVDLAPAQTALTWARILDPGHGLGLRVAEGGGGLAGFAVWLHHPSSWQATDDCYLEDLFVDPAARGQGLGRALIADLAQMATARGFGRLYWMTDTGNARARALYDSLTPADGHIRYRIMLQEKWRG